MTSPVLVSASVSADGALGITPAIPDPPLPVDTRLQSVREGIAAGRNMGQMGEIVQLIDAVLALRSVDKQIINAIHTLTDQATVAITKLRTDATAAVTATNRELADTQAQARDAIVQLRADATTAIGNEATTRAGGDATLTTSIQTVNTNATNAIAADRARLTTIETAINNNTNGILKRLTAIENRLTAAGIA